MQINRGLLKYECREFGQIKIARHLGITETTLGIKLVDPTHKLWVSEFLAICELLNVDYQDFIQPEME